jgi:hypothetical protein
LSYSVRRGDEPTCVGLRDSPITISFVAHLGDAPLLINLFSGEWAALLKICDRIFLFNAVPVGLVALELLRLILPAEFGSSGILRRFGSPAESWLFWPLRFRFYMLSPMMSRLSFWPRR